MPEVVIRVGDLPTSKPLRAWLAGLDDVPQLALDRDGTWQDPAAAVSEIETERVRELAAAVFTLAGCSGLARCDFFVEPDGTVLVNEINTMPGFTETSVYAKLLEADGIPYPDLCDRLVALAIERHRRARSYEF